MSNIKPASAARIANQMGGHVKEQYDNMGLTCFREEYEAGASGQILVREGYVEYTTLPNGRTISRKVVTRNLTVEEAEAEE